MIRILVVDDNDIMRAALKELIEIENDCEIKAEAKTSEEALRLALEEDFDVILMDISLESEDSGLELVRRLRHFGNRTPILSLSLHENQIYEERLREAGAQGYLMKQNAAENIVPAIRHVINGQSYWAA